MPFEKRIEVRPVDIALVNGAMDQAVIDQWEAGLNALGAWQLVSVVVCAGYLWAFLQREVP